MYAIVELGGRQWKVEEGTKLEVNRVSTEEGSSFEVDRVLLTQDGKTVKVGQPYVEGAKVICEVAENRQGPKVVSFKYSPRENYRKTVGHRQPLSRLVVKQIQV